MKPVSIIIAFHDEFIGVLLRTIYVILAVTPKNLLTEIILVDDASTKPYLGEVLEKETDKISSDKIRIIRLTKRLGVHRALHVGLEKATAETVVIMPSYLEPSHGWLPPLLQPLIKKPHTITTPVVEYKHWHYDQKGSYEIMDGRGAFDLQLNLVELPINVSIKNFENPIITTKVLVADKQFLKRAAVNKKTLTGLDGNLLELSLKTWLCLEGRILKVPCAKLGHNYRETGVHDDSIVSETGKFWRDYELKRIVLKYFDDYSDQFLRLNPERFGKAVKSIRNKENCKPFKHFLEQVAPDMASVFINSPTRVISGMISNTKADEMCIGTSGPSIGTVLSLNDCTNNRVARYTFTKAFDIRLQNKALCWNAYDTFIYKGQNISLVALQPCNTLEEKQRFEYDEESKAIKKIGSKFCLDAIIQRKFIALTNCDASSLSQRWVWK